MNNQIHEYLRFFLNAAIEDTRYAKKRQLLILTYSLLLFSALMYMYRISILGINIYCAIISAITVFGCLLIWDCQKAIVKYRGRIIEIHSKLPPEIKENKGIYDIPDDYLKLSSDKEYLIYFFILVGGALLLIFSASSAKIP